MTDSTRITVEPSTDPAEGSIHEIAKEHQGSIESAGPLPGGATPPPASPSPQTAWERAASGEMSDDEIQADQRRQAAADRRRQPGTVVLEDEPPGDEVKIPYLDPMDAFMSDDAQVLPIDYFVLERLNTRLKVQGIGTPQYTQLVKDMTIRRRVDGVMYEETKERELRAELIMRCVQGLDFRSPDLMKKWGVKSGDPLDLIERMFLPGELGEIQDLIMNLLRGLTAKQAAKKEAEARAF